MSGVRGGRDWLDALEGEDRAGRVGVLGAGGDILVVGGMLYEEGADQCADWISETRDEKALSDIPWPKLGPLSATSSLPSSPSLGQSVHHSNPDLARHYTSQPFSRLVQSLRALAPFTRSVLYVRPSPHSSDTRSKGPRRRAVSEFTATRPIRGGLSVAISGSW